MLIFDQNLSIEALKEILRVFNIAFNFFLFESLIRLHSHLKFVSTLSSFDINECLMWNIYLINSPTSIFLTTKGNFEKFIDLDLKLVYNY